MDTAAGSSSILGFVDAVLSPPSFAADSCSLIDMAVAHRYFAASDDRVFSGAASCHSALGPGVLHSLQQPLARR